MTEYQKAQQALLEAARERARAMARLETADAVMMEAIRKLEVMEARASGQHRSNPDVTNCCRVL